LASVRPEDVLRAARRIIDPKREVLAVIRPRADRASAGRGNAQRSAAALGAMALRAQER
jgi:hypothetical protein